MRPHLTTDMGKRFRSRSITSFLPTCYKDQQHGLSSLTALYKGTFDLPPLVNLNYLPIFPRYFIVQSIFLTIKPKPVLLAKEQAHPRLSDYSVQFRPTK